MKCVMSFAGGVAHEMDFPSPVLAFSCSQINAQNSALTPETMKKFNPRTSEIRK
jgi:hypothetical protein